VTVVKDSVSKVPDNNADPSRKGLEIPKRMGVVRNTAFDSFFVRIKDSVYYCTYKGKFYSSDTLGNGNHFLFDIKSEYIVDEVFFHPLSDSRYFLAWQETNHTGVNSYEAVYSRGKAQPIWLKKRKAPFPGQPVISGEAVYVSTLGMIGKYHLSTGEMYWEHDSLFDQIRMVYKHFERPLIYDSVVCFYDMPIKGKKMKRDSIWVDDNSGKIIPAPRLK